MFKPRTKNPNTAYASPAATELPASELTRISQQSLIRLRHQASQLSLSTKKIRARQSGAYLSAFRGRGMEFEESRTYQPGDDIRSMDWKVTARTGEAHTKVFCEERERPVLCWTDFRESMQFATHGVFKSVVAAKAAASIGWAASQQGDRLGGLVFSDQQHFELKPQRGKAGVLHLIKQLEQIQQHQPELPSSLHTEQSLARLRRVARPGSLIFLISDFRQLDDKAHSHIMQLARHNDIVMFFIYDRLEKDLPEKGHYLISHHGQQLHFDASSNNKNQYHQLFAQRLDELKSFARQHSISFIECSTEQEPVQQLLTAFNNR